MIKKRNFKSIVAVGVIALALQHFLLLVAQNQPQVKMK